MIYTCPMHPEVKSEKPGRCPKCGMALVSKNGIRAKALEDKGLGEITLLSYAPLIAIIGLVFIVSLIIVWRTSSPEAYMDSLASHFMAGFFLVFTTFKLIDIKGFAEGYSTYDILAQRVFAYGYVYPFLELGLGLSMVAGYMPDWLLISEVALMSFSGAGVLVKVLKREKFQCVCLGTFLKAPLTTVTLIEDFGMAALGLYLLL